MKIVHFFYFLLFLSIGFLVGLPSVSMAQVTTPFGDALGTANDLIRSIVPVIVSIAVIVFLWGVTSYIKNANEPQKRAEGRQLIIYGLIAIFVMVSMWGFVNLIISTIFGNDDTILQDSDIQDGPFMQYVP